MSDRTARSLASHAVLIAVIAGLMAVMGGALAGRSASAADLKPARRVGDSPSTTAPVPTEETTTSSPAPTEETTTTAPVPTEETTTSASPNPTDPTTTGSPSPVEPTKTSPSPSVPRAQLVYGNSSGMRLKGVPEVGRAIRPATMWIVFKRGFRPDATRLGYQWTRNGTPISEATDRAYRLTPRDRGTKVRVVVTGLRSGYPGGTVTTEAVRVR